MTWLARFSRWSVVLPIAETTITTWCPCFCVRTARFAAGQVGSAVALKAQGGDAEWMTAPDSTDIDLPAAYTLEAWVFPTLLDETWQRLVLRWDGGFSYHFALRAQGGNWNVSLFHQEAPKPQNPVYVN